MIIFIALFKHCILSIFNIYSWIKKTYCNLKNKRKTSTNIMNMLGNSNNSLNTLQSILWNIKWVEKIPYETLGYIWELFLKVHTIDILKARNYGSNFFLDIGETIPGNSHLGQIPTLANPSKVNNLRNRGSSYYSFFFVKIFTTTHCPSGNATTRYELHMLLPLSLSSSPSQLPKNDWPSRLGSDALKAEVSRED